MRNTLKAAVLGSAVAAGAVLGTGAAVAEPVHGPAVVQASETCPVCDLGNFGDDDAGAAALAEHLFRNHFAEWLRTQPALGTGSAG